MRASAVVDVGSNTIRLLVGSPREDGSVEAECTKGVRVGLGHDIEEHGAISRERLDVAAEAVAELCRLARKQGAKRVDVRVAAPGRQASNAKELLDAIRDAAGFEPTV